MKKRAGMLDGIRAFRLGAEKSFETKIARPFRAEIKKASGVHLVGLEEVLERLLAETRNEMGRRVEGARRETATT